MFKERYHGANAYVEMTESIDSSMLATLGERRRRRFLTAILLVITLFVSCAWVASKPAAFQWLSRVAPPVAHFLRPSAGSEEENGIRVEVSKVTREGERLLIHLTLEDLEGDRLNGRTYPNHWIYEQGRSRASGYCNLRYDQETGLLHLTLTCDPEHNMQDFDWERWVTVEIEDLVTHTERIEGPWRIQVSPLTEE